MIVAWKVVNISCLRGEWSFNSFFTPPPIYNLMENDDLKKIDYVWRGNPPSFTATCGVLDYYILYLSSKGNIKSNELDFAKQLEKHGAVPGENHTCGIYTCKSFNELYSVGYIHDQGVMIQAAISGKIVEYERGYRSEFIEVMQIVPYRCKFCNECGTNVFFKDVHHEIMSLCDRHLEYINKLADKMVKAGKIDINSISLDELARRMSITVAWDTFAESVELYKEYKIYDQQEKYTDDSIRSVLKWFIKPRRIGSSKVVK